MLLCVYVCMSVFLYIGAYAFSSIIFHYRITTYITILMAICFSTPVTATRTGDESHVGNNGEANQSNTTWNFGPV